MRKNFTFLLILFAMVLGTTNANASQACASSYSQASNVGTYNYLASHNATIKLVNSFRVNDGTTNVLFSGSSLTVKAGNASDPDTIIVDYDTFSFGSSATVQLYSDASGSNLLSTCTEALPVELISFDASKTSHAIQLNWSTASELNNSHFIIERSIDGAEFLEIGTVAGNGTSNEIIDYEYQDLDMVQGVDVFYRLKQVDFDGEYEYSKVVMIKSDLEKKRIVIQNPVVNTVSVSFEDELPSSTIMVSDLTGRVLVTQSFENTALLEVDISDLIPGQYIVSVMAEGNFVQNNRIMKTN